MAIQPRPSFSETIMKPSPDLPHLATLLISRLCGRYRILQHSAALRATGDGELTYQRDPSMDLDLHLLRRCKTLKLEEDLKLRWSPTTDSVPPVTTRIWCARVCEQCMLSSMNLDDSATATLSEEERSCTILTISVDQTRHPPVGQISPPSRPPLTSSIGRTYPARILVTAWGCIRANRDGVTTSAARGRRDLSRCEHEPGKRHMNGVDQHYTGSWANSKKYSRYNRATGTTHMCSFMGHGADWCEGEVWIIPRSEDVYACPSAISTWHRRLRSGPIELVVVVAAGRAMDERGRNLKILGNFTPIGLTCGLPGAETPLGFRWRCLHGSVAALGSITVAPMALA
ncbi:hypothetical protein C8Q74DRAFT_1217078 [Fomes fomentarius]|nr:hypothetical protein C8Q74DRAFT_1217078 [Fomes fomentarius]